MCILCFFAALAMALPLIKLENVNVALDGIPILRGINWRLMPGEHWSILGANGSGKSTLLKLIRGELWPAPGSGGRRVYAFDGDEQTTAVGIKEKIALVSPELQQRYLQQEWRLTGLQVVRSGFGGGDYVYQRLAPSQEYAAQSAVDLLGVAHLSARNIQELSTGELRRLLVARALAPTPRVLICDEICDGLDVDGRASLLQALDRVARGGTQLLYTTHRAEELIPALTHWLILEKGCITRHGSMFESGNTAPLPFSRHGVGAGNQKRDPSFQLADGDAEPSTPSRALIRIQHADVFLNQKQVLHGIDWELRAGQHWAILGPNGAGKTTLLKLICGDVHPAWGGRVQRFEFTARNTIWEVKRRIGFVSPELQANYRDSVTGAEAIASGFTSSIGLTRNVTPRQQQRVRRLIGWLGLGALAGKAVKTMSYGEFRNILLARALVHDPSILVFDEPFDGLDASAKAVMAKTLESVAAKGCSLIVVSHHAGDLPACTTHLARLAGGRIVAQGPVGPRDGDCPTPQARENAV